MNRGPGVAEMGWTAERHEPRRNGARAGMRGGRIGTEGVERTREWRRGQFGERGVARLVKSDEIGLTSTPLRESERMPEDMHVVTRSRLSSESWMSVGNMLGIEEKREEGVERGVRNGENLGKRLAKEVVGGGYQYSATNEASVGGKRAEKGGQKDERRFL